jgi:hypothetical protein
MSYLKTPRAYRLQGQKVAWCCDGRINLPDGRRARVVVKRATAREAGADDQLVAAIRAEIIAKYRKPTTGQDYANQWQPPRQLPPEPDEEPPPPPAPKQKPLNLEPRKERKGDRF